MKLYGPVMTEVEALYRRRRYLLEQISKAADEINRIDGRLTYLISTTSDVILTAVKNQDRVRPETIVMAGCKRD
jgi:hypothetical protein